MEKKAKGKIKKRKRKGKLWKADARGQGGKVARQQLEKFSFQ